MLEFAARTAGARSSLLAVSLVRVVAYCLPAFVWEQQGPLCATAFALFLGLCWSVCFAASSALLWLGAATGLLSASLAATPYLHCTALVRRDGVWWRRRKNGKLERLRGLPRSLRLWA